MDTQAQVGSILELGLVPERGATPDRAGGLRGDGATDESLKFAQRARAKANEAAAQAKAKMEEAAVQAQTKMDEAKDAANEAAAKTKAKLDDGRVRVANHHSFAFAKPGLSTPPS